MCHNCQPAECIRGKVKRMLLGIGIHPLRTMNVEGEPKSYSLDLSGHSVSMVTNTQLGNCSPD